MFDSKLYKTSAAINGKTYRLPLVYFNQFSYMFNLHKN